MMPIMGRFGSANNPDLYIALVTTMGTMLSMGYLVSFYKNVCSILYILIKFTVFQIPLLNIFNRPKLVFLILPAVTLVIALLAMTQIGFPYRPETNVQRVNLQVSTHTHMCITT